MDVWARLSGILSRDGVAVMVTVAAVQGSAPREAGARLLVQADGGFYGTIGGGALEWEALEEARRLARAGGAARVAAKALGPDLGQCCGGRVDLLFERFAAADREAVTRLAAREARGSLVTRGVLVPGEGALAREVLPAADPVAAAVRRQGEAFVERFGVAATPVALFGAGHVGRALVLALAPLPFAVTWIDGRDDAFPARLPARATRIAAADPVAEMALLPAGTMVLVMTHDHALDLALVTAALSRGDLPFVGLIGSATKRARFERRLAAIGLADAARLRLTCPIGLPGIEAKEPAVIAASVAADLLQRREAMDARATHEEMVRVA